MDEYGKRVLVVDDDESARYVLSLLLEQAGYNVHSACDGLDALNQMRKRRFDVVVTDYRMPGLDGLEFLTHSRIAWPDTPVIMVSGDSSTIDEVATEQGAFAFIRKPYDRSMLLELMRSAVQPFSDHHATFATTQTPGRAPRDRNMRREVDRSGRVEKEQGLLMVSRGPCDFDQRL